MGPAGLGLGPGLGLGLESLAESAAQGTGEGTTLRVQVEAGVMPDHFDGAFVHNQPALRWLGNNHAKYGGGGEATHVWSLMSSAVFGAEHKVPQEQLAGATSCRKQARCGRPARHKRPWLRRAGACGSLAPSWSAGEACWRHSA